MWVRRFFETHPSGFSKRFGAWSCLSCPKHEQHPCTATPGRRERWCGRYPDGGPPEGCPQGMDTQRLHQKGPVAVFFPSFFLFFSSCFFFSTSKGGLPHPILGQTRVSRTGGRDGRGVAGALRQKAEASKSFHVSRFAHAPESNMVISEAFPTAAL